MRQSKTLAKLREGKLARICGMGHFLPSFVRHAAHYGFDAIWLDLEHRCMNDREVQALLGYFHLFDIDCLVRPSTLEKTKLYRYFEDGVSGLMIPLVSTAEKARMLVDAVKFPPIGERGLDGAGMDSDFVLQGGEGFTDRANRETFLFVQIETPEAVDNVEEIAAVEGVDGLFIGPADLTLRYRHKPGGGDLGEAEQRVAAAAEKYGKPWGRPAFSQEDMKHLHDAGARLIAHGGDFMAIKNMLEETAGKFDATEA